MKILAGWVKHCCPHCASVVQTSPKAEVVHECPQNKNRPTLYKVTKEPT